MSIRFEQVEHARKLLSAYLPRTRLVPAEFLSRRMGAPIWLKLESEMPTGSFKPRGAIYALSCRLEQAKVSEVVTCSTGNHGAAVAYAAKLLGVHATIFLPSNANPVKRERIAQLGARIVEEGADLAAASERAGEYARTKGVYFLDDSTAPDLPAGPATIACEILEQLPATETIYVPIGDTALIRGVGTAAKHLQPKVRIIGVQAERAPAYYLSWKQGRPVATETCGTIADGLATRTPGEANVREIRSLVDDVFLVSEEQMLRAIRILLLEEHVVAEPAGAAATAALLTQPGPVLPNTVLLVSGANISANVLRRAVIEGSEESA